MLVLIVTSPPNTVYNSTYATAGVYKSTTGGDGWAVDNAQLPSPLYGFALSRDTQNPMDLYLGTGDRGVYKSSMPLDQPASWQPWGLSSSFIWAFAQAPGASWADHPAVPGCTVLGHTSSQCSSGWGVGVAGGCGCITVRTPRSWQ